MFGCVKAAGVALAAAGWEEKVVRVAILKESTASVEQLLGC